MAVFAFCSQAVAIAMLTPRIVDVYHLIDAVCMAALLGVSYRLWFRLERRRVALALMKLIVFLGLYFLL